MSGLSSRERVRFALQHEEPDKIPIDFGAMRSSGISAVACSRLKKHLNLTDSPTKVYDIFQQLAEPEEALLKIMETDVVQLHRLRPSFGIDIRAWKKGTLPDGSECLLPRDYHPARNEKGGLDIVQDNKVIARMPKNGLYFDFIDRPYENVKTYADIDRIPVPGIHDEELVFLREQAQTLYSQTDKAILGSFGASVFEQGQVEWGYEKYFMEMAQNSDLVRYYLDRKVTVYMSDLEKYLDAVGEYIDVINFSDDLGTQQNGQISLKMYRELFKPYHRKMYQFVRNHYPRVKVFLHSCGAILDYIPDLIDAGVEVLNPVQLSAKNMDAAHLKKEFGRHLTFWGGGVNTQTTLTFGPIAAIKKEVEALAEIWRPGGGFVFTHIHNIQADISPEKVIAVYDTIKRVRAYR